MIWALTLLNGAKFEEATGLRQSHSSSRVLMEVLLRIEDALLLDRFEQLHGLGLAQLSRSFNTACVDSVLVFGKSRFNLPL